MHENNPPSHQPKEKGYHLPHYKDSELPSAMKYPSPWDVAPENLPDLATIAPLDKRAASDPEMIQLIQTYNASPGHLPETPSRALLQSLPNNNPDTPQEIIASMATYDERSNGVVYLRADKFVYAPELRDFTNGRDSPKNGRPSKYWINKYREMPYQTMPPIKQTIAYYEELSGKTYYALVDDGAHSLAGAVARGDEYIPAASVSFVRLQTNVISEQLDQLSAAEQEAKPTHRSFGASILHCLGVRKPGRD